MGRTTRDRMHVYIPCMQLNVYMQAFNRWIHRVTSRCLDEQAERGTMNMARVYLSSNPKTDRHVVIYFHAHVCVRVLVSDRT